MTTTLAEPRTRTSRIPRAKGRGEPLAVRRHLRVTVREDNICVVTFDRPGSSANFFDLRTLQELGDELTFIERQTELKGVIFMSAKAAIFIAGVDLTMLGRGATADEVRTIIERGQSVITRIAALKIPTVAAIHGAAMGGGFEMSLACDYRLASPERVTKIGLPETTIGLLPAWGGATRLPRLIGLPKALEIILAGKTLAAKPALKAGLVDELVPSENLVTAATRRIGDGKASARSHWLLNNPLAVRLVALFVRRRLLRNTRGHYPAVLKAFEVMTRGINRSIPTSLALERDGILDLTRKNACTNLLRMFFLQNRAKKLDAPGMEETEPRPVTRTAVIGAGIMGAGIAQWVSARHFPVILRDININQLANGMAGIGKLYRDAVKRHIFTALEARDGLDRIQPAEVEVPLLHTDLVIEAAVENMELKKMVFQRLDELTAVDTILATNTSALSVSELAAATRHPERVVGLHFFNPVHRMKLVEVIAARQSSPEALQRALRFTQHLGKLPVLVKDSPGFLVNRILMPYLVEAGQLFEQGASVPDLDEAMLEFGMPMGPMRLLDEVGLDVALHVAETLEAHFRDRLRVPESLRQMVAAGWLGRKSGSGYYLYRKPGSPVPNRQTADLVRGDQAGRLSLGTLQERMVLLMVNEAARCLEEQVATDPADVDFAMIMGTGFAPFHGGPLRYADARSATTLAEAMDRYVASGAAHLRPCPLLAEKARRRETFYAKG